MVEIIAEVGVNHNGDLKKALLLADAAKTAGADAVKFQTTCPELEATPRAPLAPYQAGPRWQSQLDMIRALSLSLDDTLRVAEHCADIGIEFMSTPADPVGLNFLVNGCGVGRLKIGSGDVTDVVLLEAAATAGLPVILSTGMASYDEIGAALAVLLGPSSKLGPNSITLLQCVSLYPCPIEAANIPGIMALRLRFPYRVGYSDHTGPGASAVAAVAAVGAGACLIEKHLTYEPTAEGPDHAASADPVSFRSYVDTIRYAEKAMGPTYKPDHRELENRAAARKYVVATNDIRPGDVFSRNNIGFRKCEMTEIGGLDFYRLLGRTARYGYASGAPIARRELM